MGKFISLFAGVGGFDLGMEKAGHECVAQVEWDKNAAGVLKRRWPDVPLFCDVSKVSADDLPDCDFITYGFPCQDLSVAGKREGLEGDRSGLFFQATRLIRELIARGCGLRFAVAENVAGLFSADDGRALARCIGELLESGACETGWALLDSQYFGVAQRRKRVFIVSDFGGESVDEVLAITESLPGHPAPSREAGEGIAEDATKGVAEGGRGYRMTAFGKYEDDDLASCMKSRDYKDATDLIAQGADSGIIDRAAFNQGVNAKYTPFIGNTECCPSLVSKGPHATFHKPQETLLTQGADVYNGELTGETSATVTSATGIANASGPKVIGWNGDTTPKASEDVSVTLRSQQGGEGVGVAFTASDRSNKAAWEGDISGTINCQMNSESSNLQMGVRENLTVRRLTPIECERLQGFPDDWTAEKMELILEGNEWKATGKVVKQADGPRYKAMGNAVTVNVAEWIGIQIAKTL